MSWDTGTTSTRTASFPAREKHARNSHVGGRRGINPTHVLEPREKTLACEVGSKAAMWGKYGFLGSRVIEILKQNAIIMKVGH